MLRRLLPLLLALLLPAFAFAREAAPASKPGRTLTVISQSDAEAEPDAAVVSFYFTAYGWTVDKARKKADELVQKFLDRLKKDGVHPAQIELGQPRLKPSYQFNRDLKASVPADFLASRQVLLRLEDLASVDKLMDASVSVGSFLIESAYFTVKDREELERRAFANAVESGRKKAGLEAKAMGAELGELVSAEELDAGVKEISLIQDQDFATLAAGRIKSAGPGQNPPDDSEKASGKEPGNLSLKDSDGNGAPRSEKIRASSRLRLTFSLR